jgi:hypothetical protein
LVMEKVEFPPPTPARIRLVLYWILVYSGGHEQCRWCGPGFRALPVAGAAGRRSQSGRAPGGCWWALNLDLNLSLPRAIRG